MGKGEIRTHREEKTAAHFGFSWQEGSFTAKPTLLNKGID